MPADFPIGPARKARKPRRTPNPFTRLPTKPLQRQQTQARRRVVKAEEKLPGHTVPLKHYPTLKHYTPPQRRTIVSGQKKAIKRYVGQAPTPAARAQRAEDVKSAVNLGDKETRRQLHKFIGAKHTRQRDLDAQAARRAIPKGLIVNPPGGLSVAGAKLRQLTGPSESAIQRKIVSRQEQEAKAREILGFSKLPVLKYLPGIKDLDKSTAGILNTLNRPLSAEVAAIRTYQGGGSLGEIASAAGAGLADRRHDTFSDVFKDRGFSPTASTILGLGSDIVAHPLNAVSFGASAPRDALEAGASQLMRRAGNYRVVGNAAKAQRLEAQAAKLTERAATASTNRGIQVGIPGSVRARTSGEATAHLSRATGVHALGKALREGESVPAKVVQVLGKSFNPDFRPPGVSRAEWLQNRDIHRQLRAEVSEARRHAENVGTATYRGLKKAGAGKDTAAREAVMNAIEQAPKDAESAASLRQLLGVGIKPSTKAQKRTPEYVARKVAIRQREVAAKEARDAARLRASAAERSLRTAERQAMRHQGASEVRVTQADTAMLRKDEKYMDAAREYAAAGREFRDAKKAFGNAHRNPDMWTKAERHAIEQHAATAERRLTVAKTRLRAVKATVGERLTMLDRRPPATLSHLERKQADVQLARNEHETARLAAKLEEQNYKAVKRATKKERKALTGAREDLAQQHAAAEIGKLPAHSIEELPPDLRPVAVYMHDALAAQGETALMEGVLTRLRRNYMPHQLPPERGLRRQVSAESLSRRNEHAAQRAYQGSAKEINTALAMQGKQPLFDTTNLPRLVSDYLAKSGRAVAGKNAQTRMILLDVAKPVDHTNWREALADEHNALYTMDHEGIHELTKANGEPNIEKVQTMLRKGEPVYAMKRAIGHTWTANGRLRRASQSELGRWWDRANQAMKSGLTVLNFPAYDLRNAAGDTFMAYEAGTGVRDVKDGYRMATALVREQRAESTIGGAYSPTSRVAIGQGRSLPMHQAIREAMEDGVGNTGHVGAEAFGDVRGVLDEGIRHSFGGLHPVNRLRKIGEFRENGIRFATYIGARRRGMTRAEAARHANYFHIDYGDRTDVENNLRRLIPFYTFAARNLRVQTRTLLQNPRKLAAYESVREEGAKQAGLPPNWEAGLEGYQQRGAPVPLKIGGKTRLFFPGLPLTDLSRLAALAHPGEEANLSMQMVSPMVKSPVEYAFNHSFFFNEPIYRDKKNPTARHWVAAPQLPGFVPKPVRGAFDKALGVRQIKNPSGPGNIAGYSSKLDYLLRQLPQSNFGTQVATPATGSHGSTALEQVFGQLTGIKTSEFNKGDKVNIAKISRRLDEIAVRLEDLKDIPHGDRKGGQYTKEYRRLLDEKNKLTKRRQRLIIKAGGRKPLKPIRTRKPSGTYGGSGGGGAIYGGGSSAKIYGTP